MSSTSNLCNAQDFGQSSVSKIKVTCPTCHGRGILKQSEADHMVAPIPVRDKRLKPKKTKMYLGITILVSGVCIFLVAFFLWPHSVELDIIKCSTVRIRILDMAVPYIDAEIIYQLRNNNFFNVEMTSMSLDITWNKFLLNTTFKSKTVTVDAKSVKNFTIVTRQIFQDEIVQGKVKNVCLFGWQWALFEKFVSSATISNVLRTELVTSTYYGGVDCYNSTVVK